MGVKIWIWFLYLLLFPHRKGLMVMLRLIFSAEGPTKQCVGGSQRFQKHLSKSSRNMTSRTALCHSTFFSLVTALVK